MIRSPFFKLKEIDGRLFLIPFGQATVKMTRDAEINEMGAFIWNLLKEDRTAKEVVDLCMEKFNYPEDKYSSVKTSVEAIFDRFFSINALEWDIERKPIKTDFRHKYIIAGLNVFVYGDESLILPQLDMYLEEFDSEDCLTINLLSLDKLSEIENKLIYPGEILVVDSESLEVFDGPAGYRLTVKDCKCVKSVTITHDGAYSNIEYINGEQAILCEELFLAMRIPFLLYAQKKNMVAIHSASILYKGKGWLFAGAAGSGKSTHVGLWQKYEGVKIFNGDLNLLGEKDSLITMYGIPWCGSSGQNATGCYLVAGITFLKKAQDNVVATLSLTEKNLKLNRRVHSPVWTGEQTDANLRVIDRIAKAIPMCELKCTIDKSAVDLMKSYIEKLNIN